MSTSIEFSFGFDLTQLRGGAAQASALMKRTMGGISTTSAAAFGAAAGAASEAFSKMVDVAKEAAEKVEGVFEQGAAIEALSQRTGIATGRLYQMQMALKECDVDAERLAPSINRLQLKIEAASEGSKSAAVDFRAIGLQFRALVALTPDKQFAKVASAIAALSSPAERSAAAMSIFGRAGAELLPLFNNAGAVAGMGGALSSQAEVFQQNAAKFHEASVELKQAGIAFQGFYTGMAAGVVDSFNAILKGAGAFDFVEKGREVGHVIGEIAGDIVSAFGHVHQIIGDIQATFLEVWGRALDVVDTLSKGAEAFLGVVNDAWTTVEQVVSDFLEIPSSIGDAFQSMFSWYEDFYTSFGGGMADLFASLGTKFGAELLNAAGPMIEYIQAGLEYAIEGMEAKLANLPGDPFGLKKNQQAEYESWNQQLMSLYAQRDRISKEPASGNADKAAKLAQVDKLVAAAQSSRDALNQKLSSLATQREQISTRPASDGADKAANLVQVDKLVAAAQSSRDALNQKLSSLATQREQISTRPASDGADKAANLVQVDKLVAAAQSSRDALNQKLSSLATQREQISTRPASDGADKAANLVQVDKLVAAAQSSRDALNQKLASLASQREQISTRPASDGADKAAKLAKVDRLIAMAQSSRDATTFSDTFQDVLNRVHESGATLFGQNVDQLNKLAGDEFHTGLASISKAFTDGFKPMTEAFKKHFNEAPAPFDSSIYHDAAAEIYNAVNQAATTTPTKAAPNAAARARAMAATNAARSFGRNPWNALSGFASFAGVMIHGAGGLHGAGDPGSGAYGYVRRGDAARRRGAEKEAEKRADKESKIKSGRDDVIGAGIDGTNTRLDVMIKQLDLLPS